MAITQRQIALEANVSRSTVAAVMSPSQCERISPEVRQRVMDVANRLGYTPNRYAQVISNGKSGYIGILGFGTHGTLSFQKLKMATEVFQEANYDTIVQEGAWYGAERRQTAELLVRKMLNARVEGVLLVYPGSRFLQSDLDALLKADVPVVCIGDAQLTGVPFFVSDRVWGYKQMTKHLLSLGYRRLALLQSSRSDDGKKGFLEAMKPYKGQVKPPLIVCPMEDVIPGMAVAPEQMAFQLGWLGMRRVLAASPRPEAVVCANDHWAVGALKACAEAGVRVPEEMALTGFENDPMGGFGFVPLTTLDHPVQEIAHQSAKLLLKMIQTGKHLSGTQPAIRGTLIIRNSCGAYLRTP